MCKDKCKKTNDNVLVSVIIPIYNVEKYLSKSIESVLNQTFADFELLLIDDGSPDNCGIICDEYEKKDSRIKVFHRKNFGLSASRNFGVDKAVGKYVCFLDSDDWYAPNALEIMVDLVENQKADIGMIFIKETETENVTYDGKDESVVLSSSECLSTMLKEHTQFVQACNKIYSRELVSDIKFPEGKYFEDLFVAVEKYSRIDRLIWSKKSCMFYRKRPGSITHSSFTRKSLDYYKGLEHVNDMFLSLNRKDLYAIHANKTLACYMDYSIKLEDSCFEDKDLLINELKIKAKKLFKTLPIYKWKLYIIKRYFFFILSLKLYRYLVRTRY